MFSVWIKTFSLSHNLTLLPVLHGESVLHGEINSENLTTRLLQEGRFRKVYISIDFMSGSAFHVDLSCRFNCNCLHYLHSQAT